ncbi:hypothetical protein ZWY2020_050322 [Hordeum vulgare]|nr:hypothetical protein ZWY2020_050322 [Hordeum vulgare]
MEAALLSGTMKVMLPKLFSLVEKSWNLHKGIKRDIKFLEKELGMILRSIDAELSAGAANEDHGAVLLLSMEELRELAHGIEDCIDRLVYRASWKQQSSLLRRRLQSPKALLTGLQFAEKLQRMKQLVAEAHERRQRYPVPRPSQAASAAQADGSPSSASFDPRLTDADLVGVDETRAKLLEQLAAAAEGQPMQLKVVSIVGCWGSGKTALAADVYRIQAGSERSDKHAWVCAALRSPGEVLMDLLRGFSSDDHSCLGNVLNTSNVGQLCVQVREKLVKKRYFIVIDDLQTQNQWKIIKSAFPDDNDGSSRVVVTTIQSVANACSSDNGYVHKMSRLDEKCSKELFSKKACPEKYSQYKQPDPTAILKKCDGQPLALVTIGEFLQSNGWPRGPACEDACKTVLDFSKYELLRVLDLEKCDDLKDDHIKGICNLLLLKYLSLGGSVTELPEDIVKLEHLEALDVRRTKHPAYGIAGT